MSSVAAPSSGLSLVQGWLRWARAATHCGRCWTPEITTASAWLGITSHDVPLCRDCLIQGSPYPKNVAELMIDSNLLREAKYLQRQESEGVR